MSHFVVYHGSILIAVVGLMVTLNARKRPLWFFLGGVLMTFGCYELYKVSKPQPPQAGDHA